MTARRDEGSTQIREILERESERLTESTQDLSEGLKTQPDQEYGVPPQTAFDALGDIRQFYRELRTEIEGVPTSNGAKGDVLAALDQLDRGFGRFERALDTGVSKRAQKRVRSAEKKLRSGADDLVAAKDRL